jgi:hypothetical protein
MEVIMTGIERIAIERKRQIEKEGWTSEHDNKWKEEELIQAAVCYAMPAELRESALIVIGGSCFPFLKAIWPFELSWWRPTPEDRIRELEKAGALISAEIDRLRRLKNTSGTGNGE